MLLVDTNIWINHLNYNDEQLEKYLARNRVLIHPLIIGELACGYIKNREEILAKLHSLPQAKIPSNTEVLYLIEKYQLYGKGLSYIDTHLLASAKLSNCKLWTLDKTLTEIATSLNLTHNS